MSSRFVVGIDYSMTCPAVVCMDRDRREFTSTQLMYVNGSKPKQFLENITGVQYPNFDCPEHRFHAISEIVLTWIIRQTDGDAIVWIEDYAFAAKGKVFHIGENTGLLKHKLWTKRIPYNVVAPTVVKKFATGKGTADKAAMYRAFVDETGTDILALSGSKMQTPGSPFADLADAYFIAKYGMTR